MSNSLDDDIFSPRALIYLLAIIAIAVVVDSAITSWKEVELQKIELIKQNKQENQNQLDE